MSDSSFPNINRNGYDASEKQWHGPKHEPADLQHFYGHFMLEKLAAQRAENIVQINNDTDYQMSVGELCARSLKIAQQLTKQLGLQWGDRVCVSADHHDDLVPLVLGMLVRGVVINALHTGFTMLEFKHFIGLVRPKAVVCEVRNVASIRTALQELGHSATIVTFADGKNVDQLLDVGDLVRGWQTSPVTVVPPPRGDPSEELALIACSSGTTGLPKGISITHTLCMLGMTKAWRTGEGATILNASGLYWGTFFIGMSALQYGTIRVFSMQSPLTVEVLLDVLERRRIVDTFVSVPVIIAMLAILRSRQPTMTNVHLPDLRNIQTTGSTIPNYVYDHMAELLPHVRLLVAYGMSDVGGAITVGGLYEDPMDSPVGSSGRVFVGTTLRVIDDDGRRCGPDKMGEIYVRKVCRYAGYLDNEAINKEAYDADGFLKTGDIGRIDEDGNLFLVDRRKDFIKYSGYQIAPSELEQFIEQRFADAIQSAVVVGIPDHAVMFVPVAVVVKKVGAKQDVTAEEIRQAIKDNFSDAKQLRGGVYFVESLPRTSSNKVRRNVVQEMAQQFYSNSSK